ncbi:MAG: hypothetical protein U5K36_01620 [Roseovarius sp.]|nr:hypothetical protein [Roseovarius sp.]
METRRAADGFFGTVRAVRSARAGAAAPGRPPRDGLGRARPAAATTTRCAIEDGFLRSRGLGADLVAPLSLVCDDLGIYYDPARESRLERLIAARAALRPDQQQRAPRR